VRLLPRSSISIPAEELVGRWFSSIFDRQASEHLGYLISVLSASFIQYVTAAAAATGGSE